MVGPKEATQKKDRACLEGPSGERGCRAVSPETLGHQSHPQVERRSDSQEEGRKTEQRWVREVTEVM